MVLMCYFITILVLIKRTWAYTYEVEPTWYTLRVLRLIDKYQINEVMALHPLNGFAKKEKFKKSEITREVGGSRSHSDFFGGNRHKIALNQY